MKSNATLWSADRNYVVHLRNCAASGPGVWPYVNSAHDVDQLVSLLERPDLANGHWAPSPMVACVECIAPLVGS